MPSRIHSSRAAAHSGRRAVGVGDALVAGPEDKRLDELVEHHAVIDACSVTAQRMVLHTRWQQREDSSRIGSNRQDGTAGTRSLRSPSVRTPDRRTRACLYFGATPD